MMSPHSPKYQDLPNRPLSPIDQPDSDSDTYSEADKLAWDDSLTHNPSMRRRRLKSIRSAISTFRALLDTILLLVVVGLLLERRSSNQQNYQIAGDITTFSPPFSQQITTFAPDPGFVPNNVSDFFSLDVQKKWLSIVPRGLGYVTINNTRSFSNLPTQLSYYPPGTFTTSMTHQLHCLHAIVEVVAALTSNQTNRMPPEGPWHLAHCFDYLRQSIMCCGDMALEGQQTTFPTGFRGSDGWDAKHVCKDYGQMIEHLEGNRADDEVWI